jgi:hypothetical protein
MLVDGRQETSRWLPYYQAGAFDWRATGELDKPLPRKLKTGAELDWLARLAQLARASGRLHGSVMPAFQAARWIFFRISSTVALQ